MSPAVSTVVPSGILPLFKPEGFTSFDCVAKLRGILRIKRLGHAGTLDPMATGVLPVFTGLATKACDILPDKSKSYRAGFQLGVSTDTLDSTGTVLYRKDASSITRTQIEETFCGFQGEIVQIPPMYSAVSVDGVRLYELARQGKTVERPGRSVTVFRLKLCDFDEQSKSGILEADCSGGTYIRTLIDDIGNALGCGGMMTSLVRTQAAGFSLEECFTFERITAAAPDFSSLILPVERIFSELPCIYLSEKQGERYRHGVKFSLEQLSLPSDLAGGENEMVAVYDPGEFLGTAYINRSENLLRIGKNFYRRD